MSVTLLLLWVLCAVLLVFAIRSYRIVLIRAALLGVAVLSAITIFTSGISLLRLLFFGVVATIALYVRYRYSAMICEADLLNLGNPFVAAYLLKTASGPVLIDTGFPTGMPAFRALAKRNDFAIPDIRFIFVTHAHPDHVGLVAELFGLAPAAKVVGTAETFARLAAGHAPVVNGRRGLGWPGRLAKSRGRRGPSRFPALDVPEERRLLFDGTRQGLRDAGVPADIIPLPGHTADSIGLLLDDGRLFCGDAAMNGLPGEGRHSIAAENVADYKRSWDVMSGSGAKWIYPAHGPRFPVADLAKYKHAVDGREYLVS
jgi:glyoxylase-like metal-dependent hydrolase (beta-lactamase superfamily II)